MFRIYVFFFALNNVISFTDAIDHKSDAHIYYKSRGWSGLL